MTSKKRASQNLVEKILMTLANVPDLPPLGTVLTPRTAHTESIESIRKHHSDLFGFCTDLDIWTIRNLLRDAWKSSNPREREWNVFVLRNFHAHITRLHQAFGQDSGKKMIHDFHVTRATQEDWLERFKEETQLASLLYNLEDANLAKDARESNLSVLTKFEETFFHLQRNLHRAQVCQNPECPAPFFFRKKIGQKYCSTSCEAPMRRESKRKSWHKHKKEWKRR